MFVLFVILTMTSGAINSFQSKESFDTIELCQAYVQEKKASLLAAVQNAPNITQVQGYCVTNPEKKV